jgi:hypothetical protein
LINQIFPGIDLCARHIAGLSESAYFLKVSYGSVNKLKMLSVTGRKNNTGINRNTTNGMQTMLIDEQYKVYELIR